MDPDDRYAAYLAKELNYVAPLDFAATEAGVRNRSLLRELPRESRATIKALADGIRETLRAVRPPVRGGLAVVILSLAFFKLALPVAASVLLGIDLASAHAGPAFIAALALSVLIQAFSVSLGRGRWFRLCWLSALGAVVVGLTLLGLAVAGMHVWTAAIAVLSSSVPLLVMAWGFKWGMDRALRLSALGAVVVGLALLGLALAGMHVWTAAIAVLSSSVLLAVTARGFDMWGFVRFLWYLVRGSVVVGLVLLGLALAGMHVWTAAIATLAWSVLTQLVLWVGRPEGEPPQPGNGEVAADRPEPEASSS